MSLLSRHSPDDERIELPPQKPIPSSNPTRLTNMTFALVSIAVLVSRASHCFCISNLSPKPLAGELAKMMTFSTPIWAMVCGVLAYHISSQMSITLLPKTLSKGGNLLALCKKSRLFKHRVVGQMILFVDVFDLALMKIDSGIKKSIIFSQGTREYKVAFIG